MTEFASVGAPRHPYIFVLISASRFFFFFLSSSPTRSVSDTFSMLHVLSSRSFLSYLIVRILFSPVLLRYPLFFAFPWSLYESSRVCFDCATCFSAGLHTSSYFGTSLCACWGVCRVESSFLSAYLSSLSFHCRIERIFGLVARQLRLEMRDFCCFVCALLAFVLRTIRPPFCECRPGTANESYRDDFACKTC